MMHASVSLSETLSCLGATLAGKGRVLAKCGGKRRRLQTGTSSLREDFYFSGWVGLWVF